VTNEIAKRRRRCGERHDARDHGNRFSALILGIVQSEPFLMRARSGDAPAPEDSRERFPQTTTDLQKPPSGASG
jgi:hypothetical protein